jgi:hypothetical protein
VRVCLCVQIQSCTPIRTYVNTVTYQQASKRHKAQPDIFGFVGISPRAVTICTLYSPNDSINLWYVCVCVCVHICVRLLKCAWIWAYEDHCIGHTSFLPHEHTSTTLFWCVYTRTYSITLLCICLSWWVWHVCMHDMSRKALCGEYFRTPQVIYTLLCMCTCVCMTWTESVSGLQIWPFM